MTRGRIVAWSLLCLFVGVGCAVMFYPPVWHAAVRAWLGWQAERRGLHLEIAAMDGLPLDVTVLHGVRLRSVVSNSDTATAPAAPATDVQAGRVEFVFAPFLPWARPAKNLWLDRLVLDDVHGSVSLDGLRGRHASRVNPGSSSPAAWPRARGARFFSSFAAHLTPLNFELVVRRDADLTFHRSAATVRLRGLRLSGYTDAPGTLLVREIEARAPGGLDSVYHDWHATTSWNGTRLTINRLALAPGIELAAATLDGSRLRRKQLNGDFTLRALGGTLRGQVKAQLPGARGPNAGHWHLEVAGSLESVAVRPLTEFLSLAGPTGGVVRAGVFSFSGDPADLSAAAASLRLEVTEFQWGARRWQRLLLAATVLHRRITVHELDLVQSRNRVVLNGEGPLPGNTGAKPNPEADNAASAAAAPRFGLPPWLDNFSCNLDARIDDLEDFAHLFSPGFGLPELAGRMNAQGTLTGRERTLDGYLKIEAGPLRVRGAPLDRVRATMTFRGDELQIASLEAVHAADSLLGKGTFGLAGSGRYAAEGRLNARNLAPYQPAFASYGFPEPPTGALNLEWSGDGAAGAHSGAFRGRLNGFLARAGRVALPRRIDLEADGTYSPDSVSFRQLALRDVGDAPTPAPPVGKRGNVPPPATPTPALRFEGVALPLNQNADAGGRAVGFFHPEGAFAGRVLCADFPLDLLPPVLPGVLRAANGRLSGWLDLAGTPRASRLNGQLTLRKGQFRWAQPGAAGWFDADNVLADARLDALTGAVLRLDKGTADRPGGGTVAVVGQFDWSDAAAPPKLDFALGARNIDLINSDTIRTRADLDVTVVGPPDGARIAGTVQLRDAHFYRQFWLEPTAEEARLSLGPFVGSAGENDNNSHDNVLLARLLPLAALRSGPLASCELYLALVVDAPIPAEGPNAVRGVLRPELQLSGTGRRPRLVGKLEFQRSKSSAGGSVGPPAFPTLVPKPGQMLPVEDGTIFFDPAGTAESTVLIRDLAQLGTITQTRVRSRVAGASVFAPLDRIPLRVFDADNGLSLPSDFTAQAAAAGTRTDRLTLDLAGRQPLFPEPVSSGQQMRFFRLAIY